MNQPAIPSGQRDRQYRAAQSDERNRCAQLLIHAIQTDRDLWAVVADIREGKTAPDDEAIAGDAIGAGARGAQRVSQVAPSAAPTGGKSVGDLVADALEMQIYGRIKGAQ